MIPTDLRKRTTLIAGSRFLTGQAVQVDSGLLS